MSENHDNLKKYKKKIERIFVHDNSNYNNDNKNNDTENNFDDDKNNNNLEINL